MIQIAINIPKDIVKDFLTIQAYPLRIVKSDTVQLTYNITNHTTT